jgi:dTMP kinase
MNPAPPVTTARTSVSYGQMFVSFEGLDGSGKTTQVERLRASLEADGREVVTAREPGGTALGEQVRALVLHGGEMTPWAEALLYAAARAELVAEVIEPALARGADVLLDRYFDSSVAYQGVGRGLGLHEVLELNLLAVRGFVPDRTFLLAVDAGRSLERVVGRPDRIEREDAAFHGQVAAGYEQLAALFPERIIVLDGALDPDTLAERIQDDLQRVA